MAKKEQEDFQAKRLNTVQKLPEESKMTKSIIKRKKLE